MTNGYGQVTKAILNLVPCFMLCGCFSEVMANGSNNAVFYWLLVVSVCGCVCFLERMSNGTSKGSF